MSKSKQGEPDLAAFRRTVISAFGKQNQINMRLLQLLGRLSDTDDRISELAQEVSGLMGEALEAQVDLIQYAYGFEPDDDDDVED